MRPSARGCTASPATCASSRCARHPAVRRIAGDPPDDNDLPAREETAAVIDRTVIAEALAGATVLEIRGGKIARETIYCDHLTTRL